MHDIEKEGSEGMKSRKRIGEPYPRHYIHFDVAAPFPA